MAEFDYSTSSTDKTIACYGYIKISLLICYVTKS